jgi:hypothetical protein
MSWLMEHQRLISRGAWVAAWVGLVVGQLHALSRHATAAGAEDLELTATAAWAVPAAKAPITIAVERLASGRLGRARLQLADMPGDLDQVEFAREVIAPAPRSTPMAPSCSPDSPTKASRIAPPRATSPVTSTRSCPDRT